MDGRMLGPDNDEERQKGDRATGIDEAERASAGAADGPPGPRARSGERQGARLRPLFPRESASRRRLFSSAGALGALLVALGACGEDAPETSEGRYTVQFPSTAAAVATDFVQILVFGVRAPEDRERLCPDLIERRKRDPAGLVPDVNPPAAPANICEMRAGRKPVTVPYGEHALLAIAQRRDPGGALKDFLIGCAVMTIGAGDAPVPIAVDLASADQPVPPTECASLGDWCERRCQ